MKLKKTLRKNNKAFEDFIKCVIAYVCLTALLLEFLWILIIIVLFLCKLSLLFVLFFLQFLYTIAG